MNIFFLTETESGCFKWRAGIPGKYLQRRGHTIQIFSDKLQNYDAPDALVVFRTHYPKLERLLDWAKANRIRIVFDTDDALDLVPRENLNYRGLKERGALYQYLLEQADLVTTTTAALADNLRQWNPNIAILPNSVDPEEWTIAPRPEGIRVGWTGSATHFHDLAVALDAIREVQKKRAFNFVLQGICSEDTIEDFYQFHATLSGKPFEQSPFGKSVKRLLDKLAGMRYEFHPMVEVGEHSRKVCDLALDIGIAPLVDNAFNRNKSSIKYYEYAMSGAVTLASHVLPYSEEVPITAKNNQQWWRDRLEFLLDADRVSLARSQRDWVMEHRNMERNVELWERAYRGEPLDPAR
ncbi:MAG: hypothetical protein LAO79_18265 [Acidobacteriia bacterium]|nr:hypothetical protein [Terriglobia bacterium]